MKSRKLRLGGILVLILPMLLVNHFATKPTFRFNPEDKAMLVLSLKTITRKAHVCDDEEVKLFLKEEAKKGRKHLRKRARACGSRNRVPVKIEIKVDDKVLLKKEYQPSGFRNDGNTFGYERIPLKAGIHKIEAVIDRGFDEGEESSNFRASLNFEGLSIAVLSYNDVERKFVLASKSE